MREIKFRAWNKRKKEYELLDSMFELQKMNLAREEYNELIFEQYTGLTDKNGKEIYEGDILKDGKGGDGIVKWLDSLACFAVWADYKWWSLNEGDESKGTKLEYTEIIGNIHEDPDY